MNVYQKTEKISTWKPIARESAAGCLMQMKIYYYGGRSNTIFNDMTYYDILLKNWVQCKRKRGKMPEYGRYGHTLNGWRDNVYIFGGSLFFRLG